MSMNVKKNDTVVVLSGKDKGKKGKVLSVDPETRKVVVEKVNVASRHQKPRKQGEEGGILQKETPMYASKVMTVCPKCGKPTRVAHKKVEKAISGKTKLVSVRVCKHCGAEI